MLFLQCVYVNVIILRQPITLLLITSRQWAIWYVLDLHVSNECSSESAVMMINCVNYSRYCYNVAINAANKNTASSSAAAATKQWNNVIVKTVKQCSHQTALSQLAVIRDKCLASLLISLLCCLCANNSVYCLLAVYVMTVLSYISLHS